MNNETLNPKDSKPTFKQRCSGLLDLFVFAAEDYMYTRKDNSVPEEKLEDVQLYRMDSVSRKHLSNYLIKSGQRRSFAGALLAVSALGGASYEYANHSPVVATGLGVVALTGVYLGYNGKVEEQQGRDIRADSYLISSNFELIEKEEYRKTKSIHEVYEK